MRDRAVSSTLEDYLEAILRLVRTDGGARSRDIAEALGVHKSSVTSALRSLRQAGLVNYSPYEAVTLTPEGGRLAAEVEHRHEVLQGFLTDILGVDPAEAEIAACGMEHSVSRDIIDKLVAFAKTIQNGTEKTPQARPKNPGHNARKENGKWRKR